MGAFFQLRFPLPNRVMVAHTFNPSTWKTKAGGFLSSRLAWEASQSEFHNIQGYTENPCLEKQNKTKNKKNHTKKKTKKNKKRKTKQKRFPLPKYARFVSCYAFKLMSTEFD
jgi:hypothetical protein